MSPAVLALAMRPNDLLPPRVEDAAHGKSLMRLAEEVGDRLLKDRYEPTPAHLVPIPKTQLTTRLGALAPLGDRLVLHAYVAALIPKLEPLLVNASAVFGDDGPVDSQSWRTFEKAPLEEGSKYVVRADIASFYETISHDYLAHQLRTATRQETLADDFISLLGTMMRGSRGVPQGYIASDALATVYLDSLDRAMVTGKWRYFRRGDDIRVAVDTYSAGVRAVARIEAELRKLGLTLNDAKTMVLRASTYERNLSDVSHAEERLYEQFVSDSKARISKTESLSELEEFLASRGLIAEPDIEEVMWDLYHGHLSIEVLIDQLEDDLGPEHRTLAAALLSETLEQAPGSETPLPADVFARRMTASVAVLAAAADPVVLPQVDSILFRFPVLTEVTARYLRTLLGGPLKRQATRIIESYLMRKRFRYDWQEAWLLWALLPAAATNSEEFQMYLKRLVSDDRRDYLVKVQAVRLLSRRGKLDKATLELYWRVAPIAFKPDLIDAADSMRSSHSWAAQYIESLRDDPLVEVVLTRD